MIAFQGRKLREFKKLVPSHTASGKAGPEMQPVLGPIYRSCCLPLLHPLLRAVRDTTYTREQSRQAKRDSFSKEVTFELGLEA